MTTPTCPACGGPVRSRATVLAIVLPLVVALLCGWLGWEVGVRADLLAVAAGGEQAVRLAVELGFAGTPQFAALVFGAFPLLTYLPLSLLLGRRPRCTWCGADPTRLPPWLRPAAPPPPPGPDAPTVGAHQTAHPGLAGRLARALVTPTA